MIDIEEKLISWFSERREAGVRVTGKGMKTEALRLHKEMEVSLSRLRVAGFADLRREII